MRVHSGSWRRMLQIVRVLARHGIAHLLGSRIAPLRLVKRWLPMAGETGPIRLRMLFEDLGGSFIKFGQILALQPDILPLSYCNALFDLLDRIEPFSYAEAESIVRQELGRPPLEVFDSFDSQPLATASVGQVHVAYLDGRKVAVKVQRPEAQRQFSSDTRLIALSVGLIRRLRLRPLEWLVEPMEEFVSWTHEELDYRYEAAYSERLRTLVGSSSGQYIPRVVNELTTRRVLVVEFLDGVSLLDYLRARERGDEVLERRLVARGFDRRRFAANVVDNFLGNAFQLGTYHADLHPANLMVLPDSCVGYIDFGITGVMSRYARYHLTMMTLALARGDVLQLHEEFLKITVHGEKSDLEAFRFGLERLAEGWYAQDGASSRARRRLSANFTRIMSEMLQLSRQTRVMPERDVVKYIRSAIAIDGLITRFAPDFDLGGHLARSCARQIRSEMRPGGLPVEQMMGWTGATAQLLRHAPARGARIAERLAAGELPAKLELEEGALGDEGELRARAVRLAGIVFCGSLLVAVTTDGGLVGPALWTAELLFVGAAVLLLLATLRRLRC